MSFNGNVKLIKIKYIYIFIYIYIELNCIDIFLLNSESKYNLADTISAQLRVPTRLSRNVYSRRGYTL